MAITTDRDIFLGIHVTQETKDDFRAEAYRRDMSQSALASRVIEEWLVKGQKESLEPKRTNKRLVSTEVDIPLPLEK